MQLKFLVTLFVFFSITSSVFGASFTSVISGNWDNPATWGSASFPAAGDDVIIGTGTIVSIDVNSACLTLTLNGTGTIDFPTNNRTLTVNGLMTMNGNSQITGNAGSRTLSLLNDFIVPVGQTGGFSGISVNQPANKNFTVNGTFAPIAPNNGTKTVGNLIISQTGTWTASVNELYTFAGTGTLTDGCTISGSSTATIAINGNLSILLGVAGQHTKIGQISLTINGTTTIAGYLEYTNSGAGTKTFNNTITVGPGGTWDDTIGEDPFINCSIVNNGSWPDPTGGTGTYRVNAAGVYSYSGNNQIAFSILKIQAAATVTNSTTVKLINNGTGANAPLIVNTATAIFRNGNGVSGYLIFSNSTDPVTISGGGAVDFSPVNNTVEYARATTTQNIYSDGVTPYYKLVCSNGATKAVTGATIVNNTVTIQGSTTLDVSGGSDLTGTANLVMNGTSVFRLSSAGTVPAITGGSNTLAAGTTIEFYRGGAQTAASSATFPYQNFLISGAAGSNVNTSAVSAILGNLTINNQGLMNSNAALTITGTFTYSSASASATTMANNITTGSFLGTAGLMNFNGKKIIINANSGLWENDGITFQAPGPDVTFQTGLAQEIRGTSSTTFANLVIDNTNDDVALSVDATIGTSLTFLHHKIVTDIFNVIAAPAIPVTASSATGWVNGNFRRLINAVGSPTVTFPIGTATTYAPVTLTLNTVTNTTGNITMFTTDGDSPDIYSGLFEPSLTVNRYWSLINGGAAPGVTFTSLDGTVNFAVTDYPGALDFTKVSIRAFDADPTALTWTDVALPIITSTPTSASWTAYNTTNIVYNHENDIEIGQLINPTSIFNRVSGAGGPFLWSAAATWIQFRTGSIQLTNGSTNVTGISTLFTSELQNNDFIMTVLSPGTVYQVQNIISDTQLTLFVAPAVTVLGTYGREHVPGACSGCAAPNNTDTDAVTIGNSFIANAAGTTINLDQTGNKILTLDINTVGSPIAQPQVLQHLGANALTITANGTVSQPGANAMTDSWNVDAGSITVTGALTIGSTNNATITRIGKVNLTTGTIITNDLIFKTQTGANREQQAVLAMGNNSVIKVSGTVAFTNNRGTLTSNFGSPGSTFVYNKTTGSQTVGFPGAGAAALFQYNNLWSENTSSPGLMITNSLSGAGNMQGNLEVHNGAFLQLASNSTVAGNAAKSFVVSPGGTFEIITTAGNPIFPTGFLTFDLGAVAPFGTVIYNSDRARDISAQTYGHLLILNNPVTFTANRTYTLPNATVTVMGNMTIGDGVSAFLPTLIGTGASTLLDVRGNYNVLSGTVNANNIPSIKVGGNWTNNGTFTIGTGTVEFTGAALSSPQIIGGTAVSSFYDLKLNTVNVTDLVQLSKDASVADILTLTQGGLNLVDAGNVGRTLTISSSAVGAITRTTGYIKGEKIISAVSVPFGTVQWNVALIVGTYVFPFGRSSAEYIPFTLDKSTAGAGGTSFSVSTYGTFNTQNKPYPPTVTELPGGGDSNGSRVADRFWIITPNGYTTKPTANVTFTIANVERVAGNPNLNAQRWNPGNYWDPAFPACGAGTCFTGASSTQVTINGVTNFSPWAVTDVATPLPIELTDFTAEIQMGLVALNWRTESELKNDFFIVQKTTNAENFENVVKVKGAGTSTSPKLYSAFDFQPNPGKWYYRLQQTDFDGNLSYSKLVSVIVPESLSRSVYPNPSNGSEFNVNFSKDDIGKSAFIKLNDVSGKEQLQIIIESLGSMQVKVEMPQRLAPGLYIISIAVEHEVVRQKLLVR